MPRASQVIEGLPESVLCDMADIGRFIARSRNERGISQEDLARRMFVSRQTLHRLEAGDPSIGFAVLASALFALGMARRLRLLSESSLSTTRRSRASAMGDLDF